MSMDSLTTREKDQAIVDASWMRTQFQEFFTKPDSSTYGDVHASLVKAGFDEDEARRVVKHGEFWVEEVVGPFRRQRMLKKAEETLEQSLSLFNAEEPSLIKASVDAAKFVTSRLGKQHYSERQEVTGKDGKDLPQPLMVNVNVSGNDGDEEGRSYVEADSGAPGRNVSVEDDKRPVEPDSPGAKRRPLLS